METNKIEEQPLPNMSEETLEQTNARMQDCVNRLGIALTQKVQREGQIDILSMELRITLLVENLQMLVDLVVELSDGKFTDRSITAKAIERVEKLMVTMAEQAKAPRLLTAAAPMPPRRNGRG